MRVKRKDLEELRKVLGQIVEANVMDVPITEVLPQVARHWRKLNTLLTEDDDRTTMAICLDYPFALPF